MWAQSGLSEELEELLGKREQLDRAVEKNNNAIRKLLTAKQRLSDITKTLLDSLDLKFCTVAGGHVAKLLKITDESKTAEIACTNGSVVFNLSRVDIDIRLMSDHPVCDDNIDEVEWVPRDLDEDEEHIAEMRLTLLNTSDELSRAALGRYRTRTELNYTGDHHGLYATCTATVPFWILKADTVNLYDHKVLIPHPKVP